MRKQGFTIIEVLIATALAAVLSAALILIWNNMNQMRSRIDRSIDLYQRVMRIYMQLDRDLSGAFLPVEADMSQARMADIAVTPTAALPSGLKPAQDHKKTEVPPPLSKPFVGDQTLSELTFITNNIMQRYWSAKIAQMSAAQPRIARITYALIPDVKHPNSFLLQRTESPQIYITQSEEPQVRAYQIADGIRSVRMQYGVYIEKPQQKTTPSNAVGTVSPASVFERKVVSEWKNIETQKPPWPLVPEWVTMELELWDISYQQSRSYVFEFYIYPRFDKQKPNKRTTINSTRPPVPPVKTTPVSGVVPRRGPSSDAGLFAPSYGQQTRVVAVSDTLQDKQSIVTVISTQ